MRVAIVGAGVVGRLIALALRDRGHELTVYDRGDRRASDVAAGLLSPLAGRELPHPRIVALASRSLALWRQLATRLDVPFAADGTLVVALPEERALLDELHRGLAGRVEVAACLSAPMEPSLAPRFGRALHLPDEGWIDAQAALRALRTLLERDGVRWREGSAEPGPHSVTSHGGRATYDWVVDARGLGARADVPTLRGVRGELVFLHAPEVELRRPVRVLHARTSLYVVPRSTRRYVVGATLVESEDEGPIGVRAALELLSMAYVVHPGFADAQILATGTGCRPAMPDHLPLVSRAPGIVRLNGLYRHGFVIAPALAERARDIVEGHDEEVTLCASA